MYYDNLGFLITNYKLGPVYIDSHLNEVMNISAAIEFQKRNPPERQKAHTLTLYGKEYSFRFPSLTKEEDKEAKDITFELYDKILTLANLGYLNDYVTGLRKEIAANYHVLETEDGKRGLEKRAVLVAKSAYPSLEDQAAILMAKDMVMGRYNSEKLKYYTSKDEYEEVPISRDYEMPDPRDREKTLKFFDNYTVGLRDALLQKALKGWNEDPAHRNFQRNSLLQTWQIEFLKRRQHRTVALCPRRCVHEDSLIKLEDGSYKPAKEVTYDDRLREGKKILTISKDKTECYKITLNNGQSIIVSRNHRVPTDINYHNTLGWDLNEGRYKEARELMVGDFIPVFSRQNTSVTDRSSIDFQEGLMYGLQMGDGDRWHHRVACRYDNIREHIISSLPSYTLSVLSTGDLKPLKFNKRHGDWVELNEYSYNKYIAHNRFSNSDNWKWGVIEGIILSDGSISGANIRIATSSTRLANDLCLLLHDLGVGSTVLTMHSNNFTRGSSTNYVYHHVVISSYSELLKIINNIDISSKLNYNKLIERFKYLEGRPQCPIKNKIPKRAFEDVTIKIDRDGKRYSCNGIKVPSTNFSREKAEKWGLHGWLKYYWYQIKTIEPVGKQNVVDFEVNGDHTFIAGGMVTHNSGKSMLMALDSLCCLLEYNHKKGVHPKTVLYLSKDVRTFMAVVEYIQELLMGLGWLKNFFHFASKEQVLYFRDPRTKDVYGMIKFLTGEGRSPGVGAFGDYLYVDEAMYLHEEIFRKLEPIVTHEGAGLTVMSTFYQSGEGGDKIYDWPVKLCNLYEKESAKILDIDNHILRQYDNFVNKGVHPEKTVAGLRFTIDDVDVILDKEGIKSSYEQDPDRYLKELYCRASQKDTVFNYKPSVVNTIHDPAKHTYQIGDVNGNLTTVQEYWDLMVIGYDPARTSDMSAVVVTGYSKSRGVISVIREQQLNFADKSSFLPQAEKLLEIYQRAKTKSSQVVLAMDGSHPGVVDVLLSKNVPIFRSYKWCGGEKVTKGKTAFEFNVPKHLMIEATKFLLDNKKVEIWDTVPILLNQLETFVEIKNFYQNKSKYQGKDNHDDFVAAFMVVCRCLYEDFEFKYGLDKGPSLPDNRLKEAVEEARFKREQTIQVRPASESLTFNFWY